MLSGASAHLLSTPLRWNNSRSCHATGPKIVNRLTSQLNVYARTFWEIGTVMSVRIIWAVNWQRPDIDVVFESEGELAFGESVASLVRSTVRKPLIHRLVWEKFAYVCTRD